MILKETTIGGAYIIEPDVFIDERGTFVKAFAEKAFLEKGVAVKFEENFYSISKKNTVRGMHFQKAPKNMAKVVYVTSGSILDVILDIRKDSPTYGHYFSIVLSGENHLAMYVPSGCAHGFLSTEDNSCTIYLQEKAHAPDHEYGINAFSFGMDWGAIDPIISDKDKNLTQFKDFESPFTN